MVLRHTRPYHRNQAGRLVQQPQRTVAAIGTYVPSVLSARACCKRIPHPWFLCVSPRCMSSKARTDVSNGCSGLMIMEWGGRAAVFGSGSNTTGTSLGNQRTTAVPKYFVRPGSWRLFVLRTIRCDSDPMLAPFLFEVADMSFRNWSSCFCHFCLFGVKTAAFVHDGLVALPYRRALCRWYCCAVSVRSAHGA